MSKLEKQLAQTESIYFVFLCDCNALLGGCPASSINKLQIVQNAAARVLTRSGKYDNFTPILQSLHWLPIKGLVHFQIKKSL